MVYFTGTVRKAMRKEKENEAKVILIWGSLIFTIFPQGITLKRGLNATDNVVNTWDIINFKLKHLKEIYVDKRHKDTCVLVSKISPSSLSNYVWKRANPGNFTQFKPAVAQSKASGRSFLVTVIKFKEGHGQLLQSIQTLDRILNSFSGSQDTHARDG
jgi:hypothetical protein